MTDIIVDNYFYEHPSDYYRDAFSAYREDLLGEENSHMFEEEFDFSTFNTDDDTCEAYQEPEKEDEDFWEFPLEAEENDNGENDEPFTQESLNSFLQFASDFDYGEDDSLNNPDIVVQQEREESLDYNDPTLFEFDAYESTIEQRYIHEIEEMEQEIEDNVSLDLQDFGSYDFDQEDEETDDEQLMQALEEERNLYALEFDLIESPSNSGAEDEFFEHLIIQEERQNQIDRLPTIKYKKNTAQTTCCICMEEFKEGDGVKILPCFHMFHEKEIVEWLQENDSCPICKTDFRQPSTREVIDLTQID